MQRPSEQTLQRSLAARQQFLNQLRQPGQAQADVLRRAIELNRESAFGREHGFDQIRDVEAFRRRVPLRGYAELAPFIERAARGERGVLTEAEPLMFFTSSGSTGRAKQLPVTLPFLRECFLPFVYAAMGSFFDAYPETALRDDATINFKWDPTLELGATAAGKPYLGASQVDYAKTLGEELAAEPGTRAPWAAPPRELKDPLDRLYYRVCMAAASDVRALIGINPAVIASIAHNVAAWAPRLIRELREGTVLGVPSASANPERASWLERCAAEHGRLMPQHLWPRLQVIFCWTGSAASVYLPALRGLFGPQVELVTAPIAASEGPIAVPVDRHVGAGVLALPFVFLEFVEADRQIAADTPTLLFDQLRTGGDYQVVLSQCAGLCRYVLGDVVRVLDWRGAVPRVEFVGRKASVTLAGEPLGEWQLTRAVAQGLAGCGLHVNNFRFHLPSDLAAPELALEPIASWTDNDLASLTLQLDNVLGALHPPFARRRASGECAAVRILPLARGTFAAEWEQRVRSGIRAAQAKDRIVERDAERWLQLVQSGHPGEERNA